VAEMKKPVTRVTHPILTPRNNGDKSGDKPAGGDTCDRFSDLLHKVVVTGDRFSQFVSSYAHPCKRDLYVKGANLSPAGDRP
jgi:hypothetical protein